MTSTISWRWSGRRGVGAATSPRVAGAGLVLACLLALTNPGICGPLAAPFLGAESPALLAIRLRAALSRLFQDPSRILEVGIRKPPKEVEQSRAELRRFFRGSTLEEVEVPVLSDPASPGHFAEARVRLRNLTLMGLALEEARFQLQGLVVAPGLLAREGELRILSLGGIGMAFRVGEEALDAVSPSFSVRLRPGRFVVGGKRHLLGLPLGFEASGRLRFTPQGRIDFHDRSVSLNGLPLPGFVRAALRRRINPIFDLRSYLGVAGEVLEIEFQHIRHQPGVLSLEATARVDVEAHGQGAESEASHETSTSP